MLPSKVPDIGVVKVIFPLTSKIGSVTCTMGKSPSSPLMPVFVIVILDSSVDRLHFALDTVLPLLSTPVRDPSALNLRITLVVVGGHSCCRHQLGTPGHPRRVLHRRPMDNSNDLNSPTTGHHMSSTAAITPARHNHDNTTPTTSAVT